MVEEAIRNGTWIPPAPGGLAGFGMGGRSGRDRIDPGKKPKMWEAYVEKDDAKGYADADWDWDAVRPFSVAVVGSPQPTQPALEAGSGPTTTTDTTTNDTNHATTERMSFIRRIREYINPTPPIPPSPLSERNIPLNRTGSSANVSHIALPSGPQTVRVSVLIAMPSQSHSHSHSQPFPHHVPILKFPSPLVASPSPSSSSPTNTSTFMTHPSVALTLESSPLGTNHPAPQRHRGDEDEKLPIIEFGVAELMVRENDCKEEEDVDAQGGMDGKRPLSMGSSMYVA